MAPTKRLEVADPCAARELLHELDLVTANGVMPDFGHDGARTGYIQKRFLKRSSYIGSCFLTPTMRPWLERLFDAPEVNVASIGGAAGSDILGLLALRTYVGASSKIQGVVFEYETGWADSVAALSAVVEEEGFVDSGACSSISFSRCDVVAPLEAEVNRSLEAAARNFDLFFYMYVLVENAQGLKSSDFAHLRSTFQAAKAGAVFVFMDSSFKMWDAIKLIAAETRGAEALFPKCGRAYGNTMALMLGS